MLAPDSSHGFVKSKKAIASKFFSAAHLLPLASEVCSSLINFYNFMLRCFVYVIERFTAILYLRKHCSAWSGARSWGRPVLANAGSIIIGNGFKVSNYYAPVEISCAEGGEINIGSNVHMNYGVLVSARKSVRIGSNVMIGNLSIISDSVFPLQPGQESPLDDEPRAVEVGDNVWLAVRVTLLPGSKIGHGAVVGAGSVVSGEIPPGVIAIGNPARPVFRLKNSSAEAAERFGRRGPTAGRTGAAER